MRHFNVSLIVWEKSPDSVHKPPFLKRKESRNGSNRGPSSHQPSALPLGHTGSQLSAEERETFISASVVPYHSEPVWPSGKALGWKAEGPRFDPLRLSCLYKNGGLWTLSGDFVHTINET